MPMEQDSPFATQEALARQFDIKPEPVGKDSPSTRLWKVSFWKIKAGHQVPVYTHVIAGDEMLAAKKFTEAAPKDWYAAKGLQISFTGFLLPG